MTTEKKEEYLFFHCNNHATRLNGKLSKRTKRKLKSSFTVAAVKNGSDISFGVAKCNPSDNFSKKTGRSLALARAKVSVALKIPDLYITNPTAYFIIRAKRLIKDL